MLGTRYEEYANLSPATSAVLHGHITRTAQNASAEMNWHEDAEIQLCTAGEGFVRIDGQTLPFCRGDVVVVPCGSLHYTGTDTQLEYLALIVRNDFCRSMELAPETLRCHAPLRDEALAQTLLRMQELDEQDTPHKTAKRNRLLLDVLLRIAECHAQPAADPAALSSAFEIAKAALSYLRAHHAEKLSLDGVARALYVDKFTLAREFKKATGTTVVTYLNTYRCTRAAALIATGAAVNEAARAVGFEDASYFARVYKKCMGGSPMGKGRVDR